MIPMLFDHRIIKISDNCVLYSRTTIQQLKQPFYGMRSAFLVFTVVATQAQKLQTSKRFEELKKGLAALLITFVLNSS